MNIEYPPGFDEVLTSVREMQGTICDEECRKNQETVKLYNQYENAVENANTYHQRVKETRRDFLIASRGMQEYTQIQEKQAESDADFVINQLERDFYTQYNTIKNINESLQIQNDSEKQLNDVSQVYDSQMNALTSVMDDTTNKKQIELRKLSMIENTTNTITQWISWMTNIYWFFVLIYFIVLFIIGQGFRNKWSWITLIIMIIYPYFLSYLIEHISRYF